MFKISGFLLIITACSLIGFLKSGELKKRRQKLQGLKKSLIKFKEQIRLSYGELDRLIKDSFSYPIDYSGLYNSDCEILENLFSDIAMLDRNSAYNRCELAVELLSQKQLEAEEKHRELGKLYKSIGALGGIFICIFFL